MNSSLDGNATDRPMLASLDAIVATDATLRVLSTPPGGEDMRRFKALTFGRRCIVGAITGADLNLPYRTIVRATRELSHEPGDMLIGGAKVYSSYWPLVRRVYLSRFNHEVPVATTGEPLNLDGFERQMRSRAGDHEFEIWVRIGQEVGALHA